MDTITTVTEENELPNQTSTELLPFNSSGTQVESLGIFRTVSTTSETSVSDHLSSDLTTYFPSKSMNTSISLTEGRTPVDTAVSETPTSVVSSKSNRMYPYTRFTTVGSSEKSNRIATEHFGESNMNAITSEVSSLSVSRSKCINVMHWEVCLIFTTLWANSADDNLRYTVDSRYLEFQGTLWNTSRCPYLDISDLQNWGKNNSNNHI